MVGFPLSCEFFLGFTSATWFPASNSLLTALVVPLMANYQTRWSQKKCRTHGMPRRIREKSGNGANKKQMGGRERPKRITKNCQLFTNWWGTNQWNTRNASKVLKQWGYYTWTILCNSPHPFPLQCEVFNIQRGEFWLHPGCRPVVNPHPLFVQ